MVIPEQLAKRAAIYTRVSDSSQRDNYSLETQEEACRKYAAEHGYTIADQHVYREVHTASELYERPALQAARDAMQRGEYDVFICFDPDRFSRSQVHTALLQEFCDRAGVALKFALFDFEQSATGRFLLNARAFAAELELEKIKERTMRGRAQKIRRGMLIGNTPPPYGYRYRDNKTAYAPDPATAPVVQRIFALAAQGTPIRAIAVGLTRDGIPAPEGGVYWAPTTIRRILHRRDYIGDCRAHRWATVRQNGKSTQSARPDEEQIRLPAGVCPPLVDVAIFDTVQARLTRNKAEASRNAREPERFLLRGGFARCGCCGRSLAASFVKGDYPSYNVVSVRTEEHPTGRFRIGAEELDAAAWAKVRAILLDPETIRAAVTKHRQSDPTAGDRAAIDRAIATATKQQGNISAAMAMLDDEDARVPLVAQLKALAERKRALEAEKAGQRALREDWEQTQARLDLLEGWCARVAANIDEMTYQDRRDMLSALGFCALVWPRTRKPRYEFTASIPLPEQATGVIVRQGG